MSRFLARALAMLAAEADARAKPPDPAPVGVLGNLVIGEWAGTLSPVPSSSLSAPGALPGVMEAEADPSPPWCPPGPIVPLYRPGVVATPDLWLNRLAGNVARAMAEGATVRPCPLGGLDLERPCGRRVWVSGEHVREMQAAGLVPCGVPGR